MHLANWLLQLALHWMAALASSLSKTLTLVRATSPAKAKTMISGVKQIGSGGAALVSAGRKECQPVTRLNAPFMDHKRLLRRPLREQVPLNIKELPDTFNLGFQFPMQCRQ